MGSAYRYQQTDIASAFLMLSEASCLRRLSACDVLGSIAYLTDRQHEWSVALELCGVPNPPIPCRVPVHVCAVPCTVYSVCYLLPLRRVINLTCKQPPRLSWQLAFACNRRSQYRAVKYQSTLVADEGASMSGLGSIACVSANVSDCCATKSA